jgi:hypothetical protein
VGEFTVFSFQASSMHEELAKNPDNKRSSEQTTKTVDFITEGIIPD